MENNIVLIGMPGSGKSALGRHAAKELNIRFMDLDARIEKLEGMSIPEIFATHGEEYFRALETKTLEDFNNFGHRTILAVGGGTPMREVNVQLLHKIGYIIFINRNIDAIAKYMNYNGNRPLLNNQEKLYELYKERYPIYEAACDYKIDLDTNLEASVTLLKTVIRGQFPDTTYGVIGDPIAHSISPKLHDIVYRYLRINNDYAAIYVSRGGIASFIKRAIDSGMKGFNATIPHKIDILPYLDEISADGAACGAVNTIKISDGKLYGHNTDMGGLLMAVDRKGYAYKDNNIVIIGEGGAAYSIIAKAQMEQAKSITVLARNPKQEDTTKWDFLGSHPAFGEADLVFNATPLGMHGIHSDFKSFEFLDDIPKSALVYDLVYTPSETKLLAEAKKRGLTTENGLSMLIYQGLLADAYWLDQELPLDELYNVVYEAIS
ncbi:MAG: hypothetical protein LBN22_11370 [Clostridiales Family XIII bacterium]|jgi:shikimate dehydrogenase|nr:hypothetical protein [Clostridiales Family XIII bacterium]